MPQIRTIVVGIDFSPLGDLALAAAASLSDRAGCERIHLAHVVQALPAWAIPPVSTDSVSLAATSVFRAAQDRVNALDVPPTRAEVTRNTILGAPARDLVAEAARVKADLIVIATHHRSTIARALVGSVGSALIRAAECPVLVVGEQRRGVDPFHSVMAAVDLSPISEDVLTYAFDFARRDKARTDVLSVYEVPALTGDEDVLVRFLSPAEAAKLRDRHRIELQALVERTRPIGSDVRAEISCRGPAARAILERAEAIHADLIVMGTSGHNAWRRMFLGSTATRVVSLASCAVLIVPHQIHPNDPGA
jgi:nucleotide-binding universal stress UspA family protein